MKKAVIFDLDGTLWDSASQVTAAWNDTFAAGGIDKIITTEELKALMGMPMEAIIEALVPWLEESARLKLLDECCAREERRLLENGGLLFPDLRETIVRLRDAGYHISIVSNCQDGYIETFIEHHRMRELFDDWECPGRSGMLKAGNIRLVIERNNIDRAVYVGDTQGDLNACRKAGVPFIFAGYGFGSVDNADGVINSLRELPELADIITG